MLTCERCNTPIKKHPGIRYCRPCKKEVDRECKRQTKANNRLNGLCACGSDVKEGCRSCEPCFESTMKVIRSYAVAGLCTCGNAPELGKKKCPKCLAKTQKWRAELKELIFSYYGKQCACCGESQSLGLTIDHVDNDGAAHRRIIGPNLYTWLVQNNFPSNFQTLCFTCNIMKYRNGGVCPHQSAKLMIETFVSDADTSLP